MRNEVIQSVQPLKLTDIPEIVSAFQEISWHKPDALYRRYLDEQNQEQRSVLIVRSAGIFAGYGTIKWTSDYPPFQKKNIPEISDLNVLPKFQRQGLGTVLITSLEQLVRDAGYPKVGIGVGMTADYGAAQRLYVRLQYIPDGLGLAYRGIPVQYGASIPVDDDLVLWFTKQVLP